MTATIETIITCDSGKARRGCLRTFCDGDVRHESAKQQRATFAGNDWVRVGRRDICGPCHRAAAILTEREK